MQRNSANGEEALAQLKQRFTVFEKDVLGRGAFGTVFRGFDNVTGRFVAVKQVNASVSEVSQRDAQSLLEEFRLINALPEHPNVVRIFGAYVDNNVARIFLDWIPGGSLQSLLAKQQFRLHEATVRRMARDALRGLDFLHQHRIVHRDVKPGNLLVDVEGRVKLADFGTSKLLNATSAGGTTATGGGRQQLQGTVRFMAPEVPRGHHGAPADIWALGCTIFTLLQGELPWSVEYPLADMSELPLLFHLGTAVPPHHTPRLPYPTVGSVGIKDVIQSCFTFDPAQRPTAAALLDAPYFSAAAEDDGDAAGAETIEAYHAAFDEASLKQASTDNGAFITLATSDGSMTNALVLVNAGVDGQDAVVSGSSDEATAVVASPVVAETVSLFGVCIAFGPSFAPLFKDVATAFKMTVTREPTKAAVVIMGTDATTGPSLTLMDKALAGRARVQALPMCEWITENKAEFAMMINRERQLFGSSVCSAVPLTFAMPVQKGPLDAYVARRDAVSVFIVKPAVGTSGDGMRLTDAPTRMDQFRSAQFIVQEYIDTPLCIGGHKVDFRVYVTLVRLAPLQIAVHREGYARVAAKPYARPRFGGKAINDMEAHVTVQPRRMGGGGDEERHSLADLDAPRRRISTAIAQIRSENPLTPISENTLYEEVGHIAAEVLAILSRNVIIANAKSPTTDPLQSPECECCFQLFAFDVLVTASGTAHLLEVTEAPVRLLPEDPLDELIRRKVVRECLLLGLNRADKLPPGEVLVVDGELPFQRHVTALAPLLAVYSQGCGVRKARRYGMSSLQFSKMCRAAGISGAGCAFDTATLDLMFAATQTQSLTFDDFLKLCMGSIGPRLFPELFAATAAADMGTKATALAQRFMKAFAPTSAKASSAA